MLDQNCLSNDLTSHTDQPVNEKTALSPHSANAQYLGLLICDLLILRCFVIQRNLRQTLLCPTLSCQRSPDKLKQRWYCFRSWKSWSSESCHTWILVLSQPSPCSKSYSLFLQQATSTITVPAPSSSPLPTANVSCAGCYGVADIITYLAG